MDTLINFLKINLANSFSFYLKAHGFHWNVEGENFFEYHSLFEKIYSEVYGSIDQLAELIRTLDDYAPGSLSRLKDLSSISETDVIMSAKDMVNDLIKSNDKVLLSLFSTYKAAEAAGEIGISNIIQDRIANHQKHAWFLKASLK
jgi:starvation-inducible DNA-binding protein